MGVVDGPTEVHKIGIARQVLKDYRPHPDGWPSEFRPRKLVNARHRFEDMVGERFDDPETRHAFHGVLQTSEAPDDIMREMEQYLDLVLGNL